MPGFLPDTSCMVAAVCGWHEHHEAAHKEIERRLGLGEPMIMAAPALVETYAVLTRLPPPHRLSAADAYALLSTNFMSSVRIIALDPKSYRNLLRRLSESHVGGGKTYDAVIAECARKAQANALLTFNESDFHAVVEQGLEIVTPGKRSG